MPRRKQVKQADHLERILLFLFFCIAAGLVFVLFFEVQRMKVGVGDNFRLPAQAMYGVKDSQSFSNPISTFLTNPPLMGTPQTQPGGGSGSGFFGLLTCRTADITMRHGEGRMFYLPPSEIGSDSNACTLAQQWRTCLFGRITGEDKYSATSCSPKVAPPSSRPPETKPTPTPEDDRDDIPQQDGTPSSLGLLNLLDHRLGYAKEVRGGADGTVYRVTTLADSGPGSLRAALLSPDPLWIVFDVSGIIQLQSRIVMRSGNKTIDGRGANITISGHGITLHYASDVIFHNITIENAIGQGSDAIGGRGSDLVWIDHVTLRNAHDGLVDLICAEAGKKLRATVSWTRLLDHDKVMLVGLQHEHCPYDNDVNVTVAYSYFSNGGQRMPRVAQGTVHMFNTIFENWLIYGVTATQDGKLLIERSFFTPGVIKEAGFRTLDTYPDGRPWDGSIISKENKFFNGGTLKERGTGIVVPDYSYTAWLPTDCVSNVIKTRSGKQTTPQWTLNCSPETTTSMGTMGVITQ